jgi:hypothetical protein
VERPRKSEERARKSVERSNDFSDDGSQSVGSSSAVASALAFQADGTFDAALLARAELKVLVCFR